MNPEEKIIEGYHLLAAGVGESAIRIAKRMSVFFDEINERLNWEYQAKNSTNPDIKKYYGIYRRTKKKRIKKKQCKRIKRFFMKGGKDDGAK